MNYFDFFRWLQAILSFLNSSFVSSATGALLGAYFGARAATKFAERREKQQLLVEMLQKIVSSISLASAICNHSLTFKDQIVRDSVRKYFADRERYLEAIKKAAEGSFEPSFDIQYDFQGMHFFKHDVDELRSKLVSSIHDQPKIIMACMQLWQCLHSLDLSIAGRRSELERIAPLRAKLSDHEFANIYFGVEDASGNTDARLFDLMTAIDNLLDTSIFFSDYIASKLADLSKKLTNELGSGEFKPVSWDLKNISDPTLLPNPEEFPDWN